MLNRIQSDRMTVTKPEEDRRRRTIIVEKTNGTYGFTLQSYGIHYKKEGEIEMITYVDYVDYDGPAYRAGMREGDVILSINGIDMEKSDHKSIVNFIKNCDARMRMVVLFEDCVRKVELHMRYIQLQRILHAKMIELEKLCTKERQLLEDKWKTHSLPARKKATAPSSHHGAGSASSTPTQEIYHCRPTVSTENVATAKDHHHQHPQQRPPLIFTYQLLDPGYSTHTYVLQPSASGSGEYLLSCEQEQPRRIGGEAEQQQMSGKHQHGNKCGANKGGSNKKGQSSCYVYGSHLCSPCIQSTGSPNNDNVSLEAYDLASPCCNPHCIPSGRRNNLKGHGHRKRNSRSEETQTDASLHNMSGQEEQGNRTTRPHSQVVLRPSNSRHCPSAPRRYFQVETVLTGQCTLHSCTSSEVSVIAPTKTEDNSANISYTTSLSTDTLYWDSSCGDVASRQLSLKSNNSSKASQEPIYVQYNKPKSWDNLATRAFGGYGFGYGYVDAVAKSGGVSKTKGQLVQPASVGKCNSNSSHTPQYTPHIHRRYLQPTKSTESLLSQSKYSSNEDSEVYRPVNSTTADNVGGYKSSFSSPDNSLEYGGRVLKAGPGTSQGEHSKKASISETASRL